MYYQKTQPHIQLHITTWKQLQNGLFDYRTESSQERLYFFSSIYQIPIPRINKSIYYFIHFPITNDHKFMHSHIKLEKRKKLRSEWKAKEIVTEWRANDKLLEYRIIGGFKVHCQEINQNKRRKYQIFVQAVPVKFIQHNQDEKAGKGLPFWIVRTFQSWVLKEKQIVKFGRLELFIDQMSISPKNANEQQDSDQILDLDEKIQQSQLESYKTNHSEQKRCKICYITQEQDPSQILINPCKCKGSIEYIHVDCLKEWLQNRLTKISLESNGNIKITDRDCCQLCKTKFPVKIRKDGFIIPLMQFITHNPYIAFRPVNLENYRENQGKFYLNFQEDKEVRIGRLQQNGLLLGDQTVSRKHATVQLHQKQCHLKDQQSKYGTLVYAQGQKVKLCKKIRAFQIENSVFCFSLK